jgi:hypothetical protein
MKDHCILYGNSRLLLWAFFSDSGAVFQWVPFSSCVSQLPYQSVTHRGLKSTVFIVSKLWILKIQDQGASFIGFWWGPSSNLLIAAFLLCPHMMKKGGRKRFWCLFYWKLILGDYCFYCCCYFLRSSLTTLPRQVFSLRVTMPIGMSLRTWLGQFFFFFNSPRRILVNTNIVSSISLDICIFNHTKIF